MIAATWPHQALIQRAHWRPVGLVQNRVEGLSGETTIVPSFRGHWECEMQILLHTESQILAWDAFMGQMAGGLGVTDAPVRQRYPARDRDGHSGSARLVASLSQSGSACRGNTVGTAEHFGLSMDPVVVARTAGSIPLRGSQVRVILTNTTGIRPGHLFSIGSRLYRALRHWQDDEGHVVQFWPPAREAVAAGAVMVLDSPVCRVRLADEANGFPQVSVAPAEIVTISLIEAR